MRKSSNAPFVIHIIGADHVECKTEETLQKAVGPFIRWLHSQRQKKEGGRLQFVQEMSSDIWIEMLGPNVPIDASKRSPLDLLSKSLLSKCSNGFQSATLVSKNCVYHDYLIDLMAQDDKDDKDDKNKSCKKDSYPDFVIAFNAGIWGYNEWIPTLKQMALFEDRFPFVITGYTVEEVEDDFDVLEGVMDGLQDNDRSDFMSTTSSRCLWSPEVNPFGSRKERKTATSPHGRKYYENGGWQAWLMGR